MKVTIIYEADTLENKDEISTLMNAIKFQSAL